MKQYKTLKETMHWFNDMRGLDWSERKWKEKMKEWEFDKNIPAKEMAFMASKARKRQLDESKETVFGRNGIVVDQNKIENFKKQKLGVHVIRERLLPATPQHISYETPKPASGDGDQSNSSEMALDEDMASTRTWVESVDESDNLEEHPSMLLAPDPQHKSYEAIKWASSDDDPPSPPKTVHDNHTPSHRILPETVDESHLAEANTSTNLIGEIPTLTSSTADLDIDSTESNREIARPSDLMDDLNVSENLGRPQATSISGPTPEFSSRTVSEVLPHYQDIIDAPDDLSHLRLEKLKNDMKSADRLLKSGERESAGTEYCIAIRSYVDVGGNQDEPKFMDAVAHVVQYFKTCNKNQVRTSASQCLELLQNLIINSLIPSNASRLVSSELERLLHLLLECQPKFNLHRIVLALNEWWWPQNLYSALQSFLKGAAQPHKNSSFGDEKLNQLRLVLHLFAHGLKELLSDGFSSWLAHVADDLHNAMFHHAQRLGYSPGGGYGLFAQNTIEECSSLKQLLREPGQRIIDQKHFDSLQASVTRLASQCSASGWYDQAETLFNVLRFIPIRLRVSRIDPSNYSFTGLSKSRITFQYCLHLERQRKYEQLLSVIRDEYTALLTDDGSARSLTNDISLHAEVLDENMKLRAILSRIPPGELSFFDSAFRIAMLSKRLTEVAPIFLSSTEQPSQALEEEGDQSMDEEEVEDLDDCKSSNKYGITYTESVVTGLSLNYSDLHG